ncbi:MAG: hypothetical protein K2M46_14170, partial [Lachnospiraceae bacterium]|nr:hypothetical protein [Lachnospiraceae bacterium]
GYNRQRTIAVGNFAWFFARNYEGTEQLPIIFTFHGTVLYFHFLSVISPAIQQMYSSILDSYHFFVILCMYFLFYVTVP